MTEEGRKERPDGIHLAEDFGQEIARVILIPRLRNKCFDALSEMLETGCRGRDNELILEKCQVNSWVISSIR